MKIYTKTGDDGTTGLFSGKRVSKSSPRVELYGTVDELNSVIGIVTTMDLPAEMQEHIARLNAMLFTLGADLATPLEPEPRFPVARIQGNDVARLEELIDEYTAKLPELKSFILPGGTRAAAFLQNARTVCRRAERLAVALANAEDIGAHAVRYLNRLSDYLFVAARMANFLAGVDDLIWDNNSER